MQSEFKNLCRLYGDREYTGKLISFNSVSNSRIRNLEIVGETKEIGEGEKSPYNPFNLVGSKPEIKICGKNILNTNGKFISGYLDTFDTEAISGIQADIYRTFWIKANLKQGDKITVSSINDFYIVRIIDNNNNKYTSNCKLPYTINIVKDCTELQISFREATAGSIFKFNALEECKLQAEMGGKTTEFVPHTEQNIKILSKNIFNINAEIDMSSVGTTTTVTGNRITVTSGTDKSWCQVNFLVKLNKGEVYTLSCSEVASDDVISSNNGVMLYNKDTKAYITQTSKKNNWRVTFTAPSENIWIRLHATNEIAAVHSVTYSNIMLEKGETATEYTSYKDDYKLNSVGDVADTYNPLTGEYVQRIGKLILNGSENCTDTYYDTLGFFQINNVAGLTKNTENNILCDYFTTMPSGYKYQNTIFKQENYNVIRISPSIDIAEDLESFKKWLATNNVTILFELEKPITTIINGGNIAASIPNTTMLLEDNNNLGNIKTTLQTKGQL